MANKAQILVCPAGDLGHCSNVPPFQCSASGARRRRRTGPGRLCKTKPISGGRDGRQVLSSKRVMQDSAPRRRRQNKANFSGLRRVWGGIGQGRASVPARLKTSCGDARPTRSRRTQAKGARANVYVFALFLWRRGLHLGAFSTQNTGWWFGDDRL